eukprot:9498004-Pyramimonas_sp.AAC.1
MEPENMNPNSAEGAAQPEGSSVDWQKVQSERAQRRAEQDAKWAGANIDGRLHWSVRECYKLYAPQLKAAVRNYYVLADLAAGLTQSSCP